MPSMPAFPVLGFRLEHIMAPCRSNEVGVVGQEVGVCTCEARKGLALQPAHPLSPTRSRNSHKSLAATDD